MARMWVESERRAAEPWSFRPDADADPAPRDQIRARAVHSMICRGCGQMIKSGNADPSGYHEDGEIGCRRPDWTTNRPSSGHGHS